MGDSSGGEITELLRILAEAGYEDVLVLDQESAETVLTERRRELLALIEETDRLSVSELAAELDRQQSAVSRDLSVLYEYNVINFERDGQRKIPVLKHHTILTRPVVLGGDVEEGAFEVGTDTETKSNTERTTGGSQVRIINRDEITPATGIVAAGDEPRKTIAKTDTSDDATTVLVTRAYNPEQQRDTAERMAGTQYGADALAGLISQIDGYEFESIINIGRLGAVLKVTTQGGDPAVIKTISGANNEESHLLINSEIKALRAISGHNHIVSLLDSGTKPQPWLAMKYTPDETLREALPVQIGTGVKIIEQLCEALCYAHSKQIPHGDLKPENILLDADYNQPQVQIIDWGSALASLDEATSSMFLTRPYAPPELGAEESASTITTMTSLVDDGQKSFSRAEYEQIDVYQLGKLVYEILTGSQQVAPQDDSSTDSVSEIVPPSVLNQSLPTELDGVVQDALAADPDARYQTVEAFWNDLDAVITKYSLQLDRTIGEPSYRQATSELRRDPALTVSIADIYHRHANQLAVKGTDSKADRYYNAALDQAPEHAGVLYDYANFLADQGNHEQAIKRYQQALELAPERPEIHNNIAVSYAEQDEYEKARAHWQRALTIEEERPETHTNIASILSKQGEYDRAIEHYQRAVELDPEQPEAYNNWGYLLMETGRRERAAAKFEKAIEIGPEYAEAHANYGKLLKEMGRAEKAKEHLQEALRLQPEYKGEKYRSLLKDVTTTSSSNTATTRLA
jgi:serine/threonine protein kinase/DNA-binding transcriptional ArsR family regulator